MSAQAGSAAAPPHVAVTPPRVARGAIIGIVAPSGPVTLQGAAAGLDRLREVFAVRVAPSVFAARPPGLASFLAASDETRAAELNAMLRDPDVRAIVMARGGYGITRILPLLDAGALRADPKPIVGFSDGTALLAWAHREGVRGIHGPVVRQLGGLPPEDVAALIALLTDPTPPPPMALVGDPRIAPTARYTGHCVPANLTLASMLVGTPWALPLAGAIALLEEIGERPYELDRYLTQLLATGALASTRAVVLGDLARCVDAAPATGVPDAPDAALTVVRERLGTVAMPLAVGAPVGHGERNRAVPFGAACVLTATALEFEAGAVA